MPGYTHPYNGSSHFLAKNGYGPRKASTRLPRDQAGDTAGDADGLGPENAGAR